MSFGLSRGRQLDPAPGAVLVDSTELPPLPDEILTNPHAARLDPRQWFPNPNAPLEIEIGSGKGAFLVQQASLQPDANLLGIEWAKEFAVYTADRVRRHQLRGRLMNIRILHENAVEFIRWRVPDALVRVIHLYFSDPWPKTRHHKKRVVQDAFLGETWRILQPGGELRVVTDHDELWAWDQTHFANWMRPDHDSPTRKHGGFPPIPFEWAAFSPPESADSGELVGTNFERKFRKEGRGFHAGVLRKLI